MRRQSIILVIVWSLFMLGVVIPQTVFAQDITPTPTATLPAVTDLAPSSPVPPVFNGISTPGEGANLAGTVAISGTASAAWTLSFSYADDTFKTWFPLAQSGEPVSGGVFASWDTSSLTDGSYLLRLSVLAADAKQDFVVRVRVNHSSSSETVTPTLTATLPTTNTPVATTTPEGSSVVETTATPTGTLSAPTSAGDMLSATSISLPAATPVLIPNPAVLDPRDIYLYLGKGVLAVFVVFTLIGLMFFLRRK